MTIRPPELLQSPAGVARRPKFAYTRDLLQRGEHSRLQDGVVSAIASERRPVEQRGEVVGLADLGERVEEGFVRWRAEILRGNKRAQD